MRKEFLILKYYKLINGDLLDIETKYIVHQCNCVSTTSGGIATDIFAKFPWANIYSHRENVSLEQLPFEDEKPGEIVIKGNGSSERYVINLMGQYYPGSPRYPESLVDGYSARISYFKQGLIKIIQLPDLESVAFPYKIGCGIAGGDWDIYDAFINLFAKKTKAEVIICKKD